MLEKLKGKFSKSKAEAVPGAEKKTSKKRAEFPIKKISLSDLMATKFPPREFLMEPWLPLKGMVMVYAKRGVGKTFFALWVAYSVATGGRFLKWNAPKARKVLLLDGEMTADGLQERLNGIIASNDGQSEIPFDVITPDMQEDGMLDLSNPNHQRSLEPFLKDVDLIIVDNVATLCRSGRENETEGWSSVQHWAITQKSRGKTVMFIHHAGKNGEQRGASAREDVLDTVISLKEPPGYEASQGAVFEVRFEKSRGFCKEDAEGFKASLDEDSDGRPFWKMEPLNTSTREKVILLKNEGLSQAEIAREIGVHKSTVSRVWNAAE